MIIKTTNPATKDVIGEYELFSEERVSQEIEKTHGAFLDWRQKTIVERIPYVLNLALVLREDKEKWASIITLETGKPITESLAEIEKCAWVCQIYAENIKSWLADDIIEVDGKVNKVVFQPLGIIVAIMPWNYPFWQVLRFAIPTLLTGNAAILRHSNSVPLCAMVLQEIFEKAGFPESLFTTLLINNDITGKVIASDLVHGVAFTGSTQVGGQIAKLAGSHLKRVVLELGGSDPFVVLNDADPEIAATHAVQGRFGNCGQSCVSSKRFIVDQSIAAEFEAKFVDEVSKITVGDPTDPKTEMGPLIHGKALAEIEIHLDDALAKGGKLLTGGISSNKSGYFFNPAVISNTTPDMKVVAEEVFGPIAPIIIVNDEEEAIRVANDTEFGLGACIWTRDLDRGEKVALQIDAGVVFVNSITKSDPRMPFGGVKKSGLGRELSKYGLLEFVNVKGVNIYDQK